MTPSDPFWDRLTTGHLALLGADDSHPDLRCGDPALVARLVTPTEDEANYAAPDVKTEDVDISHGSGSCRVRVYTPLGAGRAERPLFVWVHGGAFVAGDLDGAEADATAREVCAAGDAVVVSVDYRLATHGTHYPVPLDDVVASYLWAIEHAADLGADPRAATLGGASAGGNLAAGAALRVRDQGGPAPARLALVYPALHPVMPPASGELHDKLTLLNATMACAPHLWEAIVENYLGTIADHADGYAMPGIADDLSSLPPTLIVNCEYDGLRSSGEFFAAQLRDADVDVEVLLVPEVAHGHLARPGLAAAARTNGDLAAWVGGRSPR